MDLVNAAKQTLKNPQPGQATTVSVPSDDKGIFRGRKVIVAVAPNQYDTKDLEGVLTNTYYAIFEQYVDQVGQSGTLSIPCIATGEGGVTPNRSAAVAVKTAASFLKRNKEAEVHFVCYTDSKGEANAAAYKAEIKKLQESSIKERMKIVSGDVSKKDGTIVMPIRQDMNAAASGPTSKAIDTVAKQVLKGAGRNVERGTYDVGAGNIGDDDL